MEEENTPKKKPDTSFNRWQSVAKNLRGTWQRPSKIVKNFILQGEHDKGEYGKEYYSNFFISSFDTPWVINFLLHIAHLSMLR